jgi:RNA polymerase-associated protein LEO1
MIGKEYFNLMSKPMVDEFEYLAIQRPDQGILQTQVKLTHRLTAQPHSTQSAVHRRLTKAISGKHQKQSRTIMVPTVKDPELLKLEAERVSVTLLRLTLFLIYDTTL